MSAVLRRRPGGDLALAGVAYVALSLVLQRSLARGLGASVYAQDVPGNDALLLVWTLAWDQHALWTDPLRIFDANIFFPHRHTLLYADHLIGLAALLSPLRLVTQNPVLIHGLATLAAPALSALALFGLARALTGSAAAAFVGGLAYGFAPMRLAIDRCHLGMLSAWWLPLVLLFARRALDGGRVRDAVLAGTCLAMQGLSGIYLTAFFLPLLALAHLDWLRRFPPRRHGRAWARLLIAEGVAALLLLPTAIAYRRVQHDLGFERSIVVNALLSLTPSALPPLVPGVTLLTLGAAAVVLRRRLPPAMRAEAAFLVGGIVLALGLAVGPQVALPFGLGAVRAPYAFVVGLPGASALRAPGRMVHMALLCGAVLAAGGFAALAARAGTRARAALLGVATLAVLLESWLPPADTVPVPPAAAYSPVSAWLARQPDEVRFAELPTGILLAGALQQYFTTAHFRRTLNGNMGLLPPMYPYMVQALHRFPDGDVLADLHGLGLTHVVVHFAELPAARRARIEAAAAPGGPLALELASAGPQASRVYRLREAPPRPPLPGRPLARGGWRVEASHAAALGARAVDDDPASAWSSWGDLEAGLARWWNPVPFLDRWWAFAGSAPVRLSVDLGARADVTAVVLVLGGSDPLVAPDLTLEVSEEGTVWTAVATRLAAVPDVGALVTRAAEARLALVADAPVAARHVRIVGPTAEWRVGDLAVLAAAPGA